MIVRKHFLVKRRGGLARHAAQLQQLALELGERRSWHPRNQTNRSPGCRFARNAVATGRKSSSAGRRQRLRDLVLGDVRFAAHALRLRHRVRAVLLDRIAGPFGRV